MEYNYRLWKKWEKRFIVPKFFEQSTAKIILEIILCFSVFLFIFTRGGTIGIFLRIIFSLSGGAIMLQSLVYALSVEYKLRYEKWRMLKKYYQIFQK